MADNPPIDIQRLSGRLTAARNAVGETDRPGDLVMKVGRVARPAWNLRGVARPGADATMRLALNDVVFVERTLKTRPEDSLSWLYVYAQPGSGSKIVEGWVRSDGVLLDPPEPEATVEYVAAGDKLINLAARYYKPGGGFEWGDDARFYVAALAFVNRDRKHRPIIFPEGWTDEDFKKLGRWADLGLRAGQALWVPKRENLQALKGQFVSSGSISYELYVKFHNLAVKVWEAVVGTAAFAVGLVHGALEAVYDALVALPELIKLVWKVLRSLFTLEIIDDAKNLYDAFKGINWRQALGAFADDFMAKWEADSTWARFYFQGEVIGYVMATAALALLTAGGTAEATVLAEGGKFARILAAIAKNPVVAKVLENPTVKKIVAKAKAALKVVQEKLSPRKKLAARPPLPPGTLKEGAGSIVRVDLGKWGQPGNLSGYVWHNGEAVAYKVDLIAFEGATTAAEHEAVALARQAQREMIVRAAKEARKNGQKTLRYYTESASAAFQKHADDLARSIGDLRPGRRLPGVPGGNPQYEVTLDVAKILASNPP